MAGTVAALRARVVAASLAATAVAVAWAVDERDVRAAISQAWAPFVLVAGLLAIGAVVHEQGLFETAGRALGGVARSGRALLCAVLALVAVVTALLNLDTAAAFLTPVAIVAARRRGVAEEPFLYGTLFMTNAASLLLPGSNLTNLLVLGHDDVSGAAFAARMFPAWAAAVLVTGAFVALVVARGPGAAARATLRERPRRRAPWPAVALVVVAGTFVVGLASPAPAIAGLAVGATLAARARRRVSVRRVVEAVDPLVLAALFGAAVLLGAGVRSWSGPARLLESSNRATVVVVAALASVLVNNLPAAVVFTARPVAHPRALLLGLDLGPNLAVTGSLSAFVWLKAARSVGAHPRWQRVTQLGIVLVPLTLVAAAGALALFAPS